MISRQTQWLLLAVTAILTAGFYYPALDSSFLLDDYANLNRLDQVGEKGYLYYIFSGIAGPGGRPLSLLTFALQYPAWPDNPFAFKGVNLLIHLINGLLVFFIARFLTRKLELNENQAFFISLVTCLLWLIHPIQFSTALYVVQRMTQVSSLMILAGVCGYLHYRERYRLSGNNRNLVYAGIIIGGATCLGVLGKENGILLPLYIIVIEAIFFIDHKKELFFRAWYFVILLGPLLCLGAYLGYSFERFLDGYESRPFSMGQRVFTEAVILFDYLRDILLPRPDAFAVYHDDYPPVGGLFDPPYVWAAVVAWAGLLVTAVRVRFRWPVFSFAVLWYLAGHSLESSFLNLELYFEHRNYLPVIGVFMLVAWLMVLGYRRVRQKALAAGLMGTYLLFILVIAALELNLWARPVLQAAEWAESHPDSVRAQTNLADMYLRNGRQEKAGEVYMRITRSQPDILFPYLKRLTLRACVKGEGIEDKYWQKVLDVASRTGQRRSRQAAMAELDSLLINIMNGHCDTLNPINLAGAMLVLVENPDYHNNRWALHELLATVAIHMQDGPAALANVNRSIALRTHPSNLFLRVRVLIGMQRFEAAREALDRFNGYLDEHPREALAYAGLVEQLSRRLDNPER